MASVIEMPKLSDTMEEGGVASWLVKEGEFVEEAGPLVEIETDKATMEYQSPEEGTLLKILVPAGETCLLNAPICILGEKGESFDEKKLLSKYDGGAAPEAAAADAAAPAAAAASASATATAAAAAGEQPQAAHQQPAQESSVNSGRKRSSPLARKVAKEKGIDISHLEGTGPMGRVVLRDVEAAPSTKVAGEPAGMSAHAVPTPGEAYTDIPVTMMRKTIAKRLLAGKNDAPHFYLTVSADMTSLLDWRKRLNSQASKDASVKKISVNDLLVMACAKALQRHPEVNASWQETFIRQYAAVHVAVAVALPEGLVTPVVRNSHQLGVREISSEAGRLIHLAKSGQLAPSDYTGGTFTISNLGMMGVEDFTAIINPPQAAILAVGATIKTPYVVDDTVQIQPRMKMTLSCDHRVVDGALGASFLQTLVSYLEDPLMILA